MAKLSGQQGPSEEIKKLRSKFNIKFREGKEKIFEILKQHNNLKFGKAVDNEYTIPKTERENELIKLINFNTIRYEMMEAQKSSRGIIINLIF